LPSVDYFLNPPPTQHSIFAFPKSLAKGQLTTAYGRRPK
jgi:hypothetical protein